MSILKKVGSLFGVKQPNEDNEKYVGEVVSKYAGLFADCQTDAEKQAKIDALTDDERREIVNVETYIKLKALTAYSRLSDNQRSAVKAFRG